MQGDGNCYFRCISKALYNTENRHKDIRKTVVTQMNQNENKYAQYMNNFQQHIREMQHHDGRVSSYATEAEIFATCNVYNIDIFVNNPSFPDHEW